MGAYGDAIHVSLSSPQISSCTRGSANASSHGVHADDPGDPSARTVECGDSHDGLGELAGVDLVAAVELGLQQSDRPGVAQEAGGGVGESAVFLRLDGLPTNLLGDAFDSVENLTHRDSLPPQVEHVLVNIAPEVAIPSRSSPRT